MQLWGYVAHPSQSRSTAKGQFLFLGGRYVRDRSLSHALNEAYRGLLMVGRMPVAFLHLDIPPEEVDVNVHPTKVEVRFRDSQRVYSHLLSTLRQTFLKSDLHSRLQATQEPATSEPAIAGVAAGAHGPAAAGYRAPMPASNRATAWGGSTWPAVRATGRRSRPGSSRAAPGRSYPIRWASRCRRRGRSRCRWDSPSGPASRSTNSPPVRRRSRRPRQVIGRLPTHGRLRERVPSGPARLRRATRVSIHRPSLPPRRSQRGSRWCIKERTLRGRPSREPAAARAQGDPGP